MAKKTIVSESWSEKVDVETGEVLQLEHSESTRTIVPSEPPYIKLYIQDILYMQDMPRGLTNVLYSLLEHATYANKGLRIYLPTGLKKQLIEEIDTTKAAFDNALSKLCKGKIIKREDVGVYALNPYFFGRGEWKDIEKIRANWDYNAIDGRTFSAVITRKDGATMTTSGKTPQAAAAACGDDTRDETFSCVPSESEPPEEEGENYGECTDTSGIAV